MSGGLKRNSCIDEFFVLLKFWNLKCFPLIFKRSIFLYYTDGAQSNMIFFNFLPVLFSKFFHELP